MEKRTITRVKRQEHESERTAYIPAFGYGFLAPLYDFVMQWAMRESTFKPRLMEQARIKKGHRVLDIGCGTATLTILVKKTHPEAEVVGLDGDPKILDIARSKVTKADLDIVLDYGMVFKLPYPDNSFDRVMSSMVFHHLTRENKALTLKEVFRVLKPGGELHIADFGKPQNTLMHLISLFIGHLEETSDNVKGLLPEILRNVGFEQVEEIARFMTMFGTVALYKAQKPRVTVKAEADAE